jgi:hypothetical protein
LAVVALALVGGTATMALASPASASASLPASVKPGSLPAITLKWTTGGLPDTGTPIAVSSPNLLDVNGQQAVVVGDLGGHLWAFNQTTGTNLFGQGNPMFTGPGQISSTPSQIPGQNEVLIGVGNAATPNGGGYYAVNGNGTVAWNQGITDQPTDAKPFSAVAAGMAVGNAPGIGPFSVAGSLGQYMYAFNSGGGVLGGFPFLQPDGDYSTPAIAPVHLGSGQPFIVDNGDSTAGVATGRTYSNGNILRIISTAGQQQCTFRTNQAGESSPAVGQFFGTNTTVGIVFGTGNYAPFAGASATDTLFAVNAKCQFIWSQKLDGVTSSSPALADTMGNGQLQVVEGTNIGTNAGGSVWDLNGANGNAYWHVTARGAVIGSITSVDPDNQGYQDLLVPTTSGVQILTGKTGATLGVLNSTMGFQNSPLVTTDANGTIGITIAGYNNANQGVVDHYEIAGSTGNLRTGGADSDHPDVDDDVLNQAGGWPMFHHDAQLTGNAGIAPPDLQVPCSAPAAGPHGYYEAASDGGVFTFGNLPFCGSTGAITLNSPVVGIAATADGGGYWMVAADGGIFAFGDAKFYGSMGGQPLNKPIVGMAATPDGGGYWLVASDGGLFSFGDARFFGSTGDINLNKPIVGMAATPDGSGYWLVASDGGLFTFGSARFHGSLGGVSLNQPVVGMATDPATGGYWMVAADGGIFSFDAPYHGSMGGVPLNQPIVGMESASGGSGYRFVAADGGIFSFGDVHYYGSMGGVPLNDPVVGIAGF